MDRVVVEAGLSDHRIDDRPGNGRLGMQCRNHGTDCSLRLERHVVAIAGHQIEEVNAGLRHLLEASIGPPCRQVGAPPGRVRHDGVAVEVEAEFRLECPTRRTVVGHMGSGHRGGDWSLKDQLQGGRDRADREVVAHALPSLVRSRYSSSEGNGFGAETWVG